jgi:hypothetical protein
MLRLAFGTEREAAVVIARINATHDRVQGRLREPAGLFPAGRRQPLPEVGIHRSRERDLSDAPSSTRRRRGEKLWAKSSD